MKILLTRLGDSLGTDGINVFIYELSDALINLGHEVYILSQFANGISPGEKQSRFTEAAKQLFSVKNVPTSIRLQSTFHTKSIFLSYLTGNILFASKGSVITKEISPDFVIFNGATAMYCPCLKVVVCHDFQFRARFSKTYDKIMYRAFDGVIVPSSELRQELIKKFQLPPKKTALIPICVNASRFSPQPISKRECAILHVGTRKEKRPDITIRAFEKIAKYDPDIKLYVSGQIPAQNSSLNYQVKKLDKSISDRIFFIGNVSKEKLSDLYSHVRATCAPSDYELPVCSPTVIESLAAGTPIVGSLSAISEDILIDGFTGFRVQPYDTATFASRLIQLVTEDDLWKRMSRNALETAHLFDKLNVARSYLQAYKFFSESKN